MPPRDNRIGSVEAEKKRRARKRVKVKRAPKRKPGSLRDLRVDLTKFPEESGLLEDIGSALKPVGEAFAKAAMGGQKPSPRGGPKVPAQLRGAGEASRVAFDTAIGPEIRKFITSQAFNPYLAGVEGAALLPLARPLRGARAAQKGTRAALKSKSVEAGYQAAEEVYSGPSIVRVRPRKRKLNESTQAIPSARSRTGRVVEGAVDKARPALGKLPGIKSPEQVWARDAERRIIHDSKVEALPGVLADKSIKRLSRAEKYALYARGTDTTPEQWVEFYTRRLDEVDDPVVKAAIKTHIANFTKAAKVGDSKKLDRAWEHLQGSSEAREAILSRGGYLDPDTIVQRRSAPGRIARGARWTPEEEHAWNVVRASPSREQLRQAMLANGVDEGAVEAQLNILDHQNRAHWQKDLDDTRKAARRLEQRISEILDQEAAGETIDEPRLRALEEALAIANSKLEEGVPYDDLYQRLGAAAPEHPDALKAFYQAMSRDNVEFKRGSVDDATFATQAASELHGTLGRKGKLTEAKLAKGISTLVEYARRGAPYRAWYEDSANRILQIAGGDRVMAERIAQLVAIYSPQNEIMPNMAQALKAWKQWKAGEAIKVATGDKDRKALAVLQGSDYSGRKTNTFYRNMLEDIDPQKYADIYGGDDVTVDRWMYRIFGLGDADTGYYDVIQDATRAAMQHLGFEKPKQVQAASWVIAKAEGLVARHKNLTFDDALGRAMKSYADAIEEPVYTTRFPFEARPGSSDVIPEYASWSPEVQRAFIHAKVPALNSFFEELGLPFTIRETTGAGFWMGENGLEVNPALAIDVHSGMSFSTKTAQDLAKAGEAFRLSDEETALWDSVAGAIATAFNQHAASWFRPLRAANRSQESLVHVNIGRGLSEQEQTALAERLSDHAWFSHADDGVYIARADWSDLGMPEWRRLVEEVTDELGDGDRTWYGHVSGYLEGDDLARSVSNGRGPEGLPDALGRLRQASDEVDAGFRADPDGHARRVRDGRVGGRAAGSVDESRRPAIHRGDGHDAIAPEVADRLRNGPPGTGFLHGAHARPGNVVAQLVTGSAEKSSISVSRNSLVPTETWVHELAHFWQTHFPGAETRLKRILGDDKEDWVEAYLEYVLDLYPQRKLPQSVRDSFDQLSAAILKEAQETGGSFVRSGMPRELAELFDTTLWFKQLRGGQIRGAEDFTGGIYTAVERGFPVSLRHPLASTRRRLQSLSGLFQGRAGVKGGYKDPTVKKHFQGRSVESGWIKIADLGKANYNALLKAIRMDNVQVARAELLKASTDVPTRADDIAVFVDPAQRAPAELKRFWEAVEQMGDDIDVNRLSLREVDELDKDLLDRIHETAFPADIDGKPSRAVAQEIIDGLSEPIDGIRWISSDAFHASELFSAPSAFFNRANNWGRMEAGGKVIDTANDLMKLSLLPLNPAYAPMNLLGNLALNLMQQGPFAIMNLPRAAFLARELGPDAATAVDYYMGRGIMHLGETSVIGQNYSATVSNWLGAVIDVVPRRAAFLHEAWAMGFRSGEDVEQLLGNQAFADELYEVVQRANDAIIDYERLSPFERKYLQRILFIWPWIRGATRYTYRFPQEHPIQAMAFAFALERQQAMADEQLGDRPWYAKFNIPIGEVERFGQEYPLVLNPKQIVPFTTPYDFASVLTSWAQGDPTNQSPIEQLQPFWPALVTSITGYDSFAQREVDRGPGTFLSQAANFPLRSAIENVSKSDEELEDAASNRLYPRNHQDELLKVGLGSLAPTPYNAEKGQHYAAGKKGPTPEQRMRDKQEQIRGFYDESLQPRVDLALSTKVEFEHAKEARRKELGRDDLTDIELTEVMLEVVTSHVSGIDESYVRGRLDESNASRIRGALERELSWDILEAATTAANKKARADEARAEGAVIGG
jgi:hypothetical protein